MAAYAIDIDSPAGPALNGIHEGSSAEQSPASSGISSESPTVTPSLTFQFGASPTAGKDDSDTRAVNGSPSSRYLSEDVDAKTEDREETAGTEDVHMDDYSPEELDIKPDLASLDLASPTAQSPTIASRRPRGRPRKHPKPEQTSLAKKPMGRSKTGCITCRRRKKKCDERKPTCNLSPTFSVIVPF
jgi:Fungal Zn(2)-Cys(6) binuclear cluster domain